MGSSNVYIKSNEETIESLIKDGAKFLEIKYEASINENELLEMRFPPYNSTVVHLCAWYNNICLLDDLVPFINKIDNYVNILDSVIFLYRIKIMHYLLVAS